MVLPPWENALPWQTGLCLGSEPHSVFFHFIFFFHHHLQGMTSVENDSIIHATYSSTPTYLSLTVLKLSIKQHKEGGREKQAWLIPGYLSKSEAQLPTPILGLQGPGKFMILSSSIYTLLDTKMFEFSTTPGRSFRTLKSWRKLRFGLKWPHNNHLCGANAVSEAWVQKDLVLIKGPYPSLSPGSSQACWEVVQLGPGCISAA